MKTILVTGVAGFIGTNFVRLALEETKNRVVVADKLTYAGSLLGLRDLEGNPRFVFVRADIADGLALEAIFREQRPSAVVYLAAETHVDRSIDDPAPFVQTNVVGTFRLLEAARAYVAGLDGGARSGFRFLHVSTDEVYGSLGPEGAFSETDAYAPNSPYAASKAAADHLVRAYHVTYGLPAIITNSSNNYGPYQFPEKLIPLALLNAVEGRPIPIYGDGGNVRDWLHVTDHCRGILRVLKRGSVGAKYNMGGGNEHTNLHVIDRLCAVLERILPASRNPALAARGVPSYCALKTFVEDRPGHDRRYALDATRIRRDLGWAPVHDLDTGLDYTVRWYLENRTWCEAVLGEKYDLGRLGLGRTRERA